MPTYEYKCDNCEYRFEVFQAMSDEPIKKCPECGKKVRRLIFGGAGIIFKGSGFYITDKAAGSSSKKGTKPVPSGDTGSDSSKPAAATAADTGAVKETSAGKSETQGSAKGEGKGKTKPADG